MRQVLVKSGQSIWDIANALYGSVEGVYWLCDDNALTLDSFIQSGQVLSVRDEKLSSEAAALVADYFASSARVINNSDDTVTTTGVPLQIAVIQLINARDGKGGIVVVDVRGGTPGYVFAWVKAGDVDFLRLSQNLSNAEPGTYTLTVTDIKGQFATLTVDILNRITKKYLAKVSGGLILTVNQGSIIVS